MFQQSLAIIFVVVMTTLKVGVFGREKTDDHTRTAGRTSSTHTSFGGQFLLEPSFYIHAYGRKNNSLPKVPGFWFPEPVNMSHYRRTGTKVAAGIKFADWLAWK